MNSPQTLERLNASRPPPTLAAVDGSASANGSATGTPWYTGTPMALVYDAGIQKLV